MRAVIYTRVSKEDRREGRSVGDQEVECREAAAEHGWTIVEVFSDDGRSASRYATKIREEYERLVTFLGQGGTDLLVLWESSRGGRELERWAALLNLCRAHGVKIHVYTHGKTYDLEVARDWRTLAEDGVDSAYESDKTRDRVLRGVRRNAVQGRPHGKLAYGYAREYSERGTFVRQYEKLEEAEIIRECGRRVLTGSSLYSIAQDLNARGVPAPTGGKWLPNQIKRLVISPRYIGQRVYRGAVIGEAVWPAILDESTYLDCKARLEDPRRCNVRDRSLRYLLSGTARCGVCGAKFRVIKNRGYYAYACYEKFCTAVKVERLEEYVVMLVIARLSGPDFLAALAAPQPGGGAAPQNEAQKLRERLDGFYAASAAGELTPAGLAAVESRLLTQIAEVEAREQVARVPSVLRELSGVDVAQHWETLPVGTRREVIDALMSIKVNKTVRGSRFSPDRVEIVWKTL